MIVEEPRMPPGEPPRSSEPREPDLLAERRARRAAESADPALLRRAEAAEATIRTLETHLVSLQQRLREAEETTRDSVERLAEQELELRRLEQQEYAEQQLRIEAEQALQEANRRLADEDSQARALAELGQRVAELERRSEQLVREIELERAARERTERNLEAMRESHTAMATTIGELRALAASLRALADRQAFATPTTQAPVTTVPEASPSHARAPVPPTQPPVSPAGSVTPGGVPSVSGGPKASETSSGDARSGEMAEALAIAVERLQARMETQPLPHEGEAPTARVLTTMPADAPELVRSQPPAQASPQTTVAPAAQAKPHRHSRSLIARIKAARKQRHARK